MNEVAGFGYQQQLNNHPFPTSEPINQGKWPVIEKGALRYNSGSNQENLVGQQEKVGMSLSNGNSPSVHVGRVENKLNSEQRSLQFMPSVSSYLNSNRNSANANGSVPSLSQKSCGLTSAGRLMSLPVDCDGRDRPGMGEGPAPGNSDNCAFTTNGNGIIGEAVFQPSRQIGNPPSPKIQSNNSLDYASTFSPKSTNANEYKNSFADLTELRLRTYQKNNQPILVDKKLELAESMANIGSGLGIVPGQNHGSKKPISSRYRDREFQKSYSESMYPFVNGKTLQSQSIGSMNTNKDQTCLSTVSRAQDMIEKVKSEIGKTNSLLSLKKAGAAYGEHPEDYWQSMGVPQFEDNFQNKYLNRAKQQEYRQALELQIRQKEERRVLERRKEHQHPLGGTQAENALSFGQARLGQYPNLRLPRNNFSRFENSVIHKSSFSTCGNKVEPPINQIPPSSNGQKTAHKPEFNQGYVNPQNYPVPLQPSGQPPMQRPYPPPFYPNVQQAPMLFPMPMPPPPVQFYSHPAQMPWQAPIYPYQQYLHPNQPNPQVYQQSQSMPKNSDARNSDHWNNMKEFPNAASQLPKPSLNEHNNPDANCCIMSQKVDQDDQNGNQFQQPTMLITQPSPLQLTQTFSNLEDEIDLDKMKEDDYEHKTKLKVWQTSDQLPDPDVKMAFWKAELKRQIEEKRHQRRVEEAEATETERRLDKKIQDHLEAERRELSLGRYSSEQTLKHKLKGRDHELNDDENEIAWKLGGGDACNNTMYPVKSYENRMPNCNGRKLSPPVPASQRSLLQTQNNRFAELDSNLYETSGKSHIQRTSNSDPRLLNYLVRALENETEKQELKLRKKLQRNNK